MSLQNLENMAADWGDPALRRKQTTYYNFLISKPKKFLWWQKLFGLETHDFDTMFSEQKKPELPKGFTQFKLIGSVKNDIQPRGK